MPNPFYTALVDNGTQMPVPQYLLTMLQQVKANPLGFFLQKKLDIPANIINNPDAILQYLMKAGRINPSCVEMANQQIVKMGGPNNYGR